jgi:DUF4097 and DUF4098 domain-containing protein YvlB/cell division septum initiation protein DivIVA
MSERVYARGDIARVEIDHAMADLEITGTHEAQLLLDGIDAAIELATAVREGTLSFAELPDDARLFLPRDLAVQIRRVDGNLTVRELDGALTVAAVRGDLELRRISSTVTGERVHRDARITECGEVSLADIEGHLRAHTLSGRLQIRTIGGDVEIDQATAVRIDGGVGGDVRARRLSQLDAASIGGDLIVEDVSDGCKADNIGGDVRVQRLAALHLLNIGGRLIAEEVAGGCDIGHVGGDVHVRHVDGPVTINLVGGSFNGMDLRGGLRLPQVAGDVALDTPLIGPAEYQVQAAGDISLLVEGEVHARFVAQTATGEIQTRLPLAVERGRRRNLVGVVGRGDAAVTLRSMGGDIFIGAADASQEGTIGDTETDQGEFAGAREHASAGASGWAFSGSWRPGAHGRWHKTGAWFGSEIPPRGFGFGFGFGRDREEMERMASEIRDRAAKAARKAAERAAEYAERAAKRAREADWERVSRDVRQAIERAFDDIERVLDDMGRSRDRPRPQEPSTAPHASRAQRVPLEHDEEPTRTAERPNRPADSPADTEVDARRRAILEQLRAGAISLEEAERQLDELE